MYLTSHRVHWIVFARTKLIQPIRGPYDDKDWYLHCYGAKLVKQNYVSLFPTVC